MSPDLANGPITLLQIQHQNRHVVPSTEFDLSIVLCLDAVTSAQSVSHSATVTVESGCVDPRIGTSYHVVKALIVKRKEYRSQLLFNFQVLASQSFYRGILLLKVAVGSFSLRQALKNT